MAPPEAPGARVPVQIRLTSEEADRLEAYINTQGKFPPSRPDVVKTALFEWLALQETVREGAARVPETPVSPPTILPVDASGPGVYKAKMIGMVKALQAEGKSLRQIAKQLNAEGHATLSGRGSWQQGSLSKLLEKEVPTDS